MRNYTWNNQKGLKFPGQQNKVMCLKKAIYGLKQAALVWWRALDKSMSTLGCTRLLSDSGLFVNEEKTVVSIVYVDDVLFLRKSKKDIDSLKKRFMAIWECRDLGNTKEFLCMCILQSKGHVVVDHTRLQGKKRLIKASQVVDILQPGAETSHVLHSRHGGCWHTL